MRHAEKYLLRFDGGDRSLIWESHKPLPVGYPARFVLENSKGGVRVRDLRGDLGRNYKDGLHELNFDGPQAQTFKRDGLNFEIRKLTVRPVELSPATAGKLFARYDSENDFFKRSTQYSMGALALFLLVAIGLHMRESTVKVDETVIPPQFAKILSQPKPKEIVKGRAAPAGGAMGEDSDTPGPAKDAKVAKAADTAVVKAFRAKALQSAVQGLLKGGMTSLLVAESQLLSGDSTQDAKRIFDRAPTGAYASSPDPSLGNGRGVQVAALGGGGGGGGVGGGVGSHVGYGAGQKAGIVGQGEAFVNLDLPNSSVEEGLTKDEVGKVIHSHISEIRYCYEASMLRVQDIEGKLILDFTIGGSGSVKGASVKESSLNDPRLDDCILRRLTKWAFPKPNGGVDVAVSYPFIFKALKR